MKCSIQDCPGEYEAKRVVQTTRRQGQVIVIDRVPADVCDICGDTLFEPETVRKIEVLLRQEREPTSSAPVYEFA